MPTAIPPPRRAPAVSASRRRAFAALVILAAALGPERAAAQLEATIAADAGNATYEGYERSAVFTFSSDLAYSAAWARLTAGGALSRFPSGNQLLEAAASASLFSPRVGPALIELSGHARGSDYRESQEAGRAAGEARLHVVGATAGAWLGGALGLARIPVGTRSTREVVMGGWWTPRELRGDLLLRAYGMRASWGAIDDADVVYPSGTWREAGVGAGWRSGRVELDGAIARRAGDSRGTRWDAAAAFWVLPRVALAAGAGRALRDPATEIQGSHFATAGLRVRLAPGAARASPRGLRAAEQNAAQRAPFRVADEGDGTRSITVRVAGARGGDRRRLQRLAAGGARPRG